MLQSATCRQESTDSIDLVDALEFSPETGRRAVYEAYSIDVDRDAGVATVRNDSHADGNDHAYRVTLDRRAVPMACECPAFQYHCEPGESCKHMTAYALRADGVAECR